MGDRHGAIPRQSGNAHSSRRLSATAGRRPRWKAVGIDRRFIDAMTAEIRRYPDWNIHAVLIERHGSLVYEEYFGGEDHKWGQNLGRVVFTRNIKHDIRSITKSVLSALVGITLASGKIRSLDGSLLNFFPGQAGGGKPGQSPISLRHALTRSAGLDWNEDIPYTDPRNDEIVMDRSKDPVAYVLARPMVAEPGRIWKYNGGLVQVLGTIVQRTTGKPLRDYARTVLFAPLGITDFEWMGDLAGMPAAASGLRLRPRDLAKFGSLYLHGGQRNGRLVVPADWVRESTRRQIALPIPVSAYGTSDYGYLWWHSCLRTAMGTLEVALANGNGQQRSSCCPSCTWW